MVEDKADKDYQRLLKEAKQINSKMEEMHHPCTLGKATCCEAKIDITQQDYVRLVNAFLSGEIDESILRQAIGRIGLNQCPFLNEDRLCSLQTNEINLKPLVCQSVGIPAWVSSFELEKLEEESPLFVKNIRNGKIKQIPYSICGSAMCEDCHKELEEKGKKVPFHAAKHGGEVQKFRYENQWGSTKDAVKAITKLLDKEG